LSNSSNNSIDGNVVSHNKYHGICLTSGSSYNVITNNRIACNDREGIYLIYDAEYNHIYHNLFLSHLPWNAYGGGAYWYNAITQEGNYWYDYIEEQGGYDDDGDGVGDVPYHITAGGYDQHPLMEPWGDNEPPETPIIDGPTSGKAGLEYNYTFLTTDPEGEHIQYYINWGEKKEFWLGPYKSGDAVTINHTWIRYGTFTIKAKARDFYGLETDWVTLEVTMPRSRAIKTPLFNLLQNHPIIYRLIQRFIKI
jgi:parallel beta-helix repeat protein